MVSSMKNVDYGPYKLFGVDGSLQRHKWKKEAFRLRSEAFFLLSIEIDSHKGNYFMVLCNQLQSTVSIDDDTSQAIQFVQL